MPTRSPCPRSRTCSASSCVPIFPAATIGVCEARGAQRARGRPRGCRGSRRRGSSSPACSGRPSSPCTDRAARRGCGARPRTSRPPRARCSPRRLARGDGDGAGFDHACSRSGCTPRRGSARPTGKSLADARADPLEDAHGEAEAVLERPAVRVAPRVQAREERRTACTRAPCEARRRRTRTRARARPRAP